MGIDTFFYYCFSKEEKTVKEMHHILVRPVLLTKEENISLSFSRVAGKYSCKINTKCQWSAGLIVPGLVPTVKIVWNQMTREL